MEKTIAIFDRKRDMVVYIDELLVCNHEAIITTRLEFLTTEGRVIALDKLVNKELFAVGDREMVDIMKEIDRKYSEAYDLAYTNNFEADKLALFKKKLHEMKYPGSIDTPDSKKDD